MGELQPSVHLKDPFVVQALNALGEFGLHFQATWSFEIELKRTSEYGPWVPLLSGESSFHEHVA